MVQRQEIEEEVEELEQQIKKLEDRVDTVEQNNSMNRISIQSHNIRVELSSEECDLDRMTEIASEEMSEREKQAIVGEYQVMEEENLFNSLFD